MNITIFGATGSTGRLLCKKACERGHRVTAYVRDPSRMDEAHAHLHLVQGTLEDAPAMRQAVTGADVIISALGTVERKPNSILSDGTRAIIAAARECGVGRIAAITSLGCGDSREQVNSLIMRLVIRTFAREIWADKDRQEDAIRGSGLDYLIVRPGGLTNKPARGSWAELREGESSKGSQMISRADVADYILSRTQQPEFGDDCVVLF